MISRHPPLPLLNARSALAWEFRERGRRELVMAVVAALTIPVMLRLADFMTRLNLYRASGSWGEPTAWPSSVHLAALVVQLATAVPLAWSFIARMDRHYVLPVSSRDLFLMRLVHGATFVTIAVVINNVLARLILGTDWPVVAPALYGIVGWTAALWIGVRYRGQDWRIAVGSTFVACVLLGGLMWHLFRFDGREYVDQPFTPLGIEEVGLLIATALALSRAALGAGELDRCALTGAAAYFPEHTEGALPDRLGLRGVVTTRPLSPYRTSWGALLAEEWRRNGMLYPIAAGITTALFCLIVLGAAIDEYRLTRHFSGLPDLVSAVALCGGVFLFAGAFLQVATSSHGRQTLRHGSQPLWKLTLPITDRHLAAVALGRQLLSNIAAMLASWLILLTFWLAFYGLMWVLGQDLQMRELRNQFQRPRISESAHGLFLMLVAAWVASGISEASLQTGRRWCVAIPHGLLIGFMLSLSIVSMFYRNPESYIGFCVLIGMLVSIASVIVVVRAGVIPLWWGVTAFGLWAVSWGVQESLTSFWRGDPISEFWRWTHGFAMSLVMLPISLPPLAVAWNRRR